MSKYTSPDTPRPEPHGLGFPKSARLRESRDFYRVREQGKASQARLLRVGLLRTGENFPSKLGIITSRRIGGAVTRAKVRRRLREILRACRSSIPCGCLVVVVAKSGASVASFQELTAEWLLLARRLSILPASE
ncbi:MAG: ribonuclease P protein component [Terrimicrobiaceae bacterium]